MRIMLEKVADSARKAVKLAEPDKPYGGQFLEFCSISSSTMDHIPNMHETYQKKYRSLPIFSAGIIRICLVEDTVFGNSESVISDLTTTCTFGGWQSPGPFGPFEPQWVLKSPSIMRVRTGFNTRTGMVQMV